MTTFGTYECCGASNANMGEHYAWCRNSAEKRAAVAASDAVQQPSHYRLGGVEVIDAICAWGFGEGFNRGNAIKYIARAGRKDPAKTVEDLRKAARYLEMEIRRLLGEPMTQDAVHDEPGHKRRDWPGKPDPMPYETRESYRCTPIGTAIADSVQDENGHHHVDVELGAAPARLSESERQKVLAAFEYLRALDCKIGDADEQAAETIERLRADVYRLEQALITAKTQHARDLRAAERG